MHGEFDEGDPAKTAFFVAGSADIKEMSGQLKLFFNDVRLINRRDKEAAEDKPNESTEVENSVQDIKLYLYFTKKRPKMRMIAIHTEGTKIPLKTNVDGLFGREGTRGDFEVSLKSIPDVLVYQGLAVVKLPTDKPETSEPIIYGYMKFQSARGVKLITSNELHFTAVKDILHKAQISSTGTTSDGKVAKVADRVKSGAAYHRAARKAWLSLSKDENDTASFDEVKSMLVNLDTFMIDIQAKRIFHAVDIRGDSALGISEFENFLMANDLMGLSTDIDVLDIYDSLKLTPEAARKIFDKLNASEAPEASATPAEASEAKTAAASPTQPQVKFSEMNVREGMDFSGFCEALQMLGVFADDEVIMKEFCLAAGIKEKDVEKGLLSLNAMRKGWLKLANIPEEMKKRNLIPEEGMLGLGRNRERLSRYTIDAETAYLENIAKVNGVVQKIKQDRRERKDAKRIAMKELIDGLKREAKKFAAVRNQEKRLALKKEQEEKGKKRLEEKILRNKLLLRQSQNKAYKQEELEELIKQKKQLRADQIRALGLDKMDISIKELRYLPKEYYVGDVAQTKLTFLVTLDMSRNMLDYLPESGFFYWLNNLRKLKASQNRLKHISEEIEHANKIEILELDSNRLLSLPNNLGQLTGLQRLDISNNQLRKLPDTLGLCGGLRYLYAHSNFLSHIPASIGNCIQLEYMDISRNKLVELPEDMRSLVSLFHLNVSSNRMTSLPQNIGSCTKLAYLDASTNIITFLPQSFSNLSNLQFCNLEDNEILCGPERFSGCIALAKLVMKKNGMKHLYPDIGFCTKLEDLDLSNNMIESLPAEIGLLNSLVRITLNYNRMTTIPPEFGSCVSLQSIEMMHNSITGTLPDTIGLLSFLTSLNIANNNINNIPRSIIGQVQLKYLLAENNSLSTLPDTLTTLKNLHTLDLTRNRFTRFPIELSALQPLRVLNLMGNSISLLPKTINQMTQLEVLDLSKNILRAIPVEFTDVLETVPQVSLHANPWNELPQKWGKIWAEDRIKDVPYGNSVTEAVDFLYAMKAFYNTAEIIWNEQGPLYYTNRLGLNDFMQELRERIPKTWHEGLVDYVKHVYFLVTNIIIQFQLTYVL